MAIELIKYDRNEQITLLCVLCGDWPTNIVCTREIGSEPHAVCNECIACLVEAGLQGHSHRTLETEGDALEAEESLG